MDFSAAADSPARVQAMIDRQNELVALARTADAQTFNHDAALFLLQQAEQLMGLEDWATAESLILQAKQFPDHYAAGEMTPDRCLALLNERRGTTATSSVNQAAARSEVAKLLSQAQLALDRGRMDEAQSLADRAAGMQLPDECFSAEDVRPWQLQLKIRQAQEQSGAAAIATRPAATADGRVVQAGYHPAQDTTHNAQVSADDGRGMELYRNGLEAMKAGDTAQAGEYFQLAMTFSDQLDAATRQSLQDQLTQLGRQATLQDTPAASDAAAAAEGVTAAPATQEPAGALGEQEKDLFRKMQSEVFRERAAAEQMLNGRNARGALRHLSQLREQVAQSQLSDTAKRPLLVIVDRDIQEMSAYIDLHLSEIENDELNHLRRESVAAAQQQRTDMEIKVQQLIGEFNKLVDEQRFAEAEVIARQAVALAPGLQEVELLEWKAKFLRRQAELDRINADKEDNTVRALAQIEESSTPFSKLIEFDVDNWEGLSKDRVDALQNRGINSREEQRILKTLREQTFQGSFNAEPLAQAVDRIAQLAGINIIFDRSAAQADNAVFEKPISKNFSAPISLESALKLIVADAGLVFVVEDEVVKVTSPEYQRQNVAQNTYYVGDLVAPIPNLSSPMFMNFMTPNSVNPVGMSNFTNQTWSGINQPLTLSQPTQAAQVSAMALAQQLPNSPFAGLPLNLPGWGSGPTQTGQPMYNQIAPQQLGGITAADFQDLISLIQSSIEPTSWDADDTSIRPYPNTLSLVVTQTQEVHDQIVDLLEQLRELSDVQIVIEVRFITLQDNFFERIGVDFDFAIEDNSALTPGQALPDRVRPSTIIGRQGIDTFLPAADFDIGFDQGSFASAVPQFGGFDAATAANFGFAILSDIEVFFLIQASKGDTRTNVMQAPTVTLLNGQAASVQDVTQRPFVTSVIPVVGDFAAAQQPIITILPEGSSLNVRATASNDRRFVTLSLVPVFSQITAVDTFTFEGRRVNSQFGSQDGDNNNNNNNDDDDPNTTDDDNNVDLIEGTTVQLPSFSFTSVSTTVNVPDGGTILMGGIKRLSEGRNERGVPFLSNIPYINRLFKNVGIGRDTSSLMMMVTPRIIIQKEEERRQVGDFGG